MKKTILGVSTIIFVILFMLLGVMAVNIEFNLMVRRKINTFFQPYVIVSNDPVTVYLSSNEAIIDDNSSEILMEKDNSGSTYLNVKHLNSLGTTYSLDAEHEILSIVGDQIQLWIYSDGRVIENGVEIDHKITIKQIGESWYVNLTELNGLELGKALGFYEQSYQEGENLIIKNQYEVYKAFNNNQKEWLFSTADTLKQHQKNQFELSFLYDIRNIFLKTEISNIVNREKAIAYEIDESTWFVISAENKIGYMSAKLDTVLEASSESARVVKSKFKSSYTSPIVMTWEAVYSYNPDTSLIGEMKGLNVISPTWYALEDSTGSISSKVSTDYISWAKRQNYELWVLVSNSFDIDRTHEFLKDANARKKFIEYMIEEAKLYGYKGINLDFENVYLEDRDGLTHFVHELAQYCHINNLVLSMDVTVMGGSDTWSKCYDHEKLGEIVDFLVIMAYDEYWAASPISGPVASYDWVLEHMTEIVEKVSSDKLIMGIPFYTRVWREYPSKDKANRYSTDSTAIGMEAQNAFIEKFELIPIWDDTEKLYYATFFEEDAQVKIWIENAKTIEAKLEIVNKLNLKGVAAWRRGFETPDIWDTIERIKP